MLQFFGYLSGIIAASGYFPYIRDTLLLKTKPQRTAFFIWSVLGGIAFFSQLAKGASYSLFLPGAETLLTIFVFILSIKRGVGGFSKYDYTALIVAAAGLVAWYFTKEAAVALYLVILIDATGTALIVPKAYKNPESETLISWVLATIAGLLSALSVGSFNIILLSYPFYIFLANGAVAAAIELGKKKS